MDMKELREKDMEFPVRPTHPKMPNSRTITPEQVRKYADALEAHQAAMKVYHQKIDEYQRKQMVKEQQFKMDALKECGLENHPKREKAYAFAWEHGHSGGLSNVLSWLTEVAELLKDY
jgi:hypothetical protein